MVLHYFVRPFCDRWSGKEGRKGPRDLDADRRLPLKDTLGTRTLDWSTDIWEVYFWEAWDTEKD